MKAVQRYSPKEMVSAIMVRNRLLEDKFECFNPIFLEQFRDGKLFKQYYGHNLITNEGKNTIFDVMFNDGTQIANNSWFVGLINLTSYSAIAATDVMSSHAGWIEHTAYTQATRVAWGSGASSSQTVTNASPATFNINATGTLKGIFVTSNSTKTGTTGKLWSAALFAADVPVSNGDEIRVTYTLSS